tara:strand:- start:2625 stop:3416 length:792 start_codon:yes stop_codon:yes gene_type:complete
LKSVLTFLHRSILLSLILIAGSASALLAQTDEAAFQSANEDFESGDVDSAASKYEELINRNLISADLYYNLGTTRFRQGKEGEAMLWMRRAQIASPSMPEASQNVEYLRHRLGFLEFADSRFEKFIKALPMGLGRWIASVCIWASLFSIAAAFVVRRLEPNRSTLITVSVVSLIFCIVGFRLQRYQETNVSPENFATVITESAAALTAPTPDAKTVISLPPGSEVRTLQKSGSWLYADIPGGLRGWIRSEQVEPNWPIKTLSL